uniref:Maspardin n=1 Tax=Lactuca sativa TaxID=4236 RepID=A0A9R1X048_LACSA|nr:hypothetical protein LSAT_V11C800424000 [Lactuca sativa]
MNPGIAGTTDVYYKQIMALSMKDYRVISVDIPRVWNNQEWVQAFEKHLHGTSLGGFLALLFAQHRPRRVKSLIISNAFLDTKYFLATMPWARVYYVLTGIPNGPHEPFVADSVDFVVAQVSFINTHTELFPNNLKKKINSLK